MAIPRLEEDIFECNKMLRERLRYMADCEGGQHAEVIDIPFSQDVASAMKDCFKIRNLPEGLHKEHFRSEIMHYYNARGYKRIMEGDKDILWFERNSVRDAVDVHYSRAKGELIVAVMEYEKQIDDRKR